MLFCNFIIDKNQFDGRAPTLELGEHHLLGRSGSFWKSELAKDVSVSVHLEQHPFPVECRGGARHCESNPAPRDRGIDGRHPIG